MVLATCWRSLRAPIRLATPVSRLLLLRQPVVLPRLSVQRSQQFSTSSPLLHTGGGSNPKKKSIGKAPLKKVKNKKKNKGVVAPRKARTAVGERRALRKKIVLQNAQAPAVELPEMVPELATHEPAVASVFALPLPVIDQLRTLEVFQKPQNWHLFHRPATVVRHHTLDLGRKIDWVENGISETSGEGTKSPESSERHARYILDGPKGSGKSVLLLQTMAYALQKGWVVINIPNAQDLVIGHTEYEFDTITKLWTQREYTKALLGRIHKANGAALQGIELSKSYIFSRQQIPQSMGLGKLVEMGAKDSTVSYEVFNALFEELSAPNRPPVLFALDNFNQLCIPSAYRDQEFNIIHPHELAIPRTFISYLTNARRFPRGITIASTSASNAPRTEALKYALRQQDLPSYSKLDTRIAPSIKGAEILKVGGIDKEETRALLEYYRRSRLFNHAVDETKLKERMALSACLPKELLMGCVRLTT